MAVIRRPWKTANLLTLMVYCMVPLLHRWARAVDERLLRHQRRQPQQQQQTVTRETSPRPSPPWDYCDIYSADFYARGGIRTCPWAWHAADWRTAWPPSDARLSGFHAAGRFPNAAAAGSAAVFACNFPLSPPAATCLTDCIHRPDGGAGRRPMWSGGQASITAVNAISWRRRRCIRPNRAVRSVHPSVTFSIYHHHHHHHHRPGRVRGHSGPDFTWNHHRTSLGDICLCWLDLSKCIAGSLAELSASDNVSMSYLWAVSPRVGPGCVNVYGGVRCVPE